MQQLNSEFVKMDYWLNLNKRPCWDSIHDPFASEANPWTAGLRYLLKGGRMGRSDKVSLWCVHY